MAIFDNGWKKKTWRRRRKTTYRLAAGFAAGKKGDDNEIPYIKCPLGM